MYSGISFTTNKSVSEILSTLSVLEGYNVKQISDRQAIIHVGSVFKYSFYGVYTSVDYLPPMNIAITQDTQNDNESIVAIGSRTWGLISTKRNEEFVNKGYDTIRNMLT